MKSKLKLSGIIATISVFGLSMTACAGGGTDAGNGSIEIPTMVIIGVVIGLLVIIGISVFAYAKGIEWVTWVLGTFGTMLAGLIVFAIFPVFLGVLGFIFGPTWLGAIVFGASIGLLIGVIFGSTKAGGEGFAALLPYILGGAIGGAAAGVILRLIITFVIFLVGTNA